MQIPIRPYILRALHQWLSDSGLTPHILVDATQFGVLVPNEYIEDGRIVLNISQKATGALVISNEELKFSARFGGVSRNISVPISAVLGIYAKENGAGTIFDEEEYKQKIAVEVAPTKGQDLNSAPEDASSEQKEPSSSTEKTRKSPPHLKIIK